MRYRTRRFDEVDPTEKWWNVERKTEYGWEMSASFLPTRSAARAWIAARTRGKPQRRTVR